MGEGERKMKADFTIDRRNLPRSSPGHSLESLIHNRKDGRGRFASFIGTGNYLPIKC
jgi:hypothetical protein